MNKGAPERDRDGNDPGFAETNPQIVDLRDTNVGHLSPNEKVLTEVLGEYIDISAIYPRPRLHITAHSCALSLRTQIPR